MNPLGAEVPACLPETLRDLAAIAVPPQDRADELADLAVVIDDEDGAAPLGAWVADLDPEKWVVPFWRRCGYLPGLEARCRHYLCSVPVDCCLQ